jgi:hypothetical protein
MNSLSRAAATITLAGTASHAMGQELVTFGLSFVEVIAGSPGAGTPVANPNGRLNLGEAARLEVTITITPGIGSPTTYPMPPPPGEGTIAGLGSIYFDMVGSGDNGGAGTWTGLSRATGWALGGVGFPSPLGDRIHGAQAGQFVSPGATANAANPIQAIWRGVWTPSSYAGNYSFMASPPLSPATAFSSILVNYGLDPGGNPLYVGKFVASNFGGPVPVLVVPVPATALPLALMPLLARRRR